MEMDILREVIGIAIALTEEKNFEKLLSLILEKSMDLTSSDGGSLYLVLKDGLHFKIAKNRSVPISFEETVLPVSSESIAGFVALKGEVVNIKDAYLIDPSSPFRFNKNIDEKINYRTKSILTIPMKNHKEEVIGVLQLINKKKKNETILKEKVDFEEEVISYSLKDENLMLALSSLAAVSIENNQLYQEIENLFEGFVKASVKAIEQRDPTTSGHSLRVSILTTGMAEAINRIDQGPFKKVFFDEISMKELKYAALLHDFGKVGVREEVLVKAKKLYPVEMERIWWRIEYEKKNVKLRYLMKKFLEKDESKHRDIEMEEESKLKELDEIYNTILRANEPTILPEGDFATLQKLKNYYYESPKNTLEPLLNEREVEVLSIRKGSLSEEERIQIESHVIHTYNFLIQIPWTKDLRGIPEIAYAHHEKLNGSGYPRKLLENQIPLQARMMAVADIFDALSAADRPYKKAVPVEKALNILAMEAEGNMLDKNLVEIFIKEKVWERTLHLRLTR
ncbi:MAG: HD domain-containing phosphohydrolase [Thermoanaerobaculia bacterium]